MQPRLLLRVMTNLSKVMDIFSDILAKSRFEQQPVKGNFIPRPDPKKNTTEENEDETSVILAKESPIQGPGIPTKDSEPSEEVVGKGKKAAHSHEVDASVPDNSTYVVGMEKSDRTISRAKKQAKSHQRDRGQSAMYTRQERLLDAPSELEEMKETHGARMTGKLATDPRGKAEIKRHRRQANKLLDRAAALEAKSPSTRRRERAMPKRGGTRTYSTGKQPSWELTRGSRGGRNRGMSETTPTSTTGRRVHIPDRDFMGYDWTKTRPDSIYNKRGSDKYKNIDRDTLNPNKILKAFGVPISMPGGKQRTLPIIPTSEGGFFTKETGGRHGLHPVEHRPKTVTEKRKHPHADGGEEHDSGARGATPAAFGMMKAGKKIKRLKDSAERIKELIRGGAGLDRSYRPGQKQHPKFAEEQAKLDEENPPFKEAALLYPAHQKEQQGGRKVKTRVGDSPGGFPT